MLNIKKELLLIGVLPVMQRLLFSVFSIETARKTFVMMLCY